MTGFKNRLLAAVLCLLIGHGAAAQDKMYVVPPVHLLPLKKMQTNAYGTIVPDKTDILNETLWKNAAYPVTAAKFSQLPPALPAAAEELRLKLLKLAAEPPQGTVGQDFITLKLQILFDQAQFNDVYRLIQKIPEKVRSDAQNKIYADVLLTQDLQTACFLTDKGSDSVFWQELAAVCAALDQEENKALLALDVLKEQNEADAFIVNAADHFLFQKPLKTVPANITPLTAAVWRRIKGSLADLNDQEGQLWFKAMFVLDEAIPVEKRLAVAEELVQKGILSPSKLRTYYQQVSFENRKEASASAPELQRAHNVQLAAELSSRPDDNLKKQTFVKNGFQSAKKAHISYAFSAAIKDILKTLSPDIETLAESADIIEAFALAGLKEQALDWQKKAEMLFPISETTAYGWYFAELAQPDKSLHFFIPALENMMAYAENSSSADAAFIAKIDRLMLMCKALDMIPSDESWHYTSFAEDSAEDDFADWEKRPAAANKPAGDIVLEALRELNGSYIGLLNGLSALNVVGLGKEAATIAAQSVDMVLNPVQANE